jgi:hypothetical protein
MRNLPVIGRYREYLDGARITIVDNIGYYIMLAMLVAAAGYSVAGRGKPKPTLSKGRRKIAVICFGIAVACALLVAMISLLPAPAPH